MMKFGIVSGVGEIGMEIEEVEVSDGPLMRRVPGKAIGNLVLVMQDGGTIPVQVAPLALSPLVQLFKLIHHINKGDTIVANINNREIQAAINQVHCQVDAMNAVAEKERDRREFILESLLRMTFAERMKLPEKVLEEMDAHEKVLAERRAEAEAQAKADAMDDAALIGRDGDE